MQIEKKNKEVCISITIPINEFEPDQCPKNKIDPFEMEIVQQTLHNILITRMDECCSGVLKMINNKTIKADQHCLYGSHYFSFEAFQAMRQLAAKEIIRPYECTRLELNQLLKSLVYLPVSLDIEIREGIFDALIDEFERHDWNEFVENKKKSRKA